MNTLCKVFELYVAPFLMGICMAAAASGVDAAVAWLFVGVGLGFVSVPEGRRMIARFTGEAI